MKLSKSEAGKLGSIKSKATAQKNKQKRIDNYDEAPHRCSHCNKTLSYDKRTNKFCSRKCSATYNNIKRGSKYDTTCKSCNKPILGRERLTIYCNSSCQQTYVRTNMYNLWLEGDVVSSKTLTLGNLLRDFEGNKCSVCGIEDWNGYDLKMELDHIDGNSENNTYQNIRLICPNCHAQTPTYKNKNSGNGRAFRRKRYAEGKSY